MGPGTGWAYAATGLAGAGEHVPSAHWACHWQRASLGHGVGTQSWSGRLSRHCFAGSASGRPRCRVSVCYLKKSKLTRTHACVQVLQRLDGVQCHSGVVVWCSQLHVLFALPPQQRHWQEHILLIIRDECFSPFEPSRYQQYPYRTGAGIFLPPLGFFRCSLCCKGRQKIRHSFAAPWQQFGAFSM